VVEGEEHDGEARGAASRGGGGRDGGGGMKREGRKPEEMRIALGWATGGSLQNCHTYLMDCGLIL
jgi:hypothetical protein